MNEQLQNLIDLGPFGKDANLTKALSPFTYKAGELITVQQPNLSDSRWQIEDPEHVLSSLEATQGTPGVNELYQSLRIKAHQSGRHFLLRQIHPQTGGKIPTYLIELAEAKPSPEYVSLQPGELEAELCYTDRLELIRPGGPGRGISLGSLSSELRSTEERSTIEAAFAFEGVSEDVFDGRTVYIVLNSHPILDPPPIHELPHTTHIDFFCLVRVKLLPAK